MEHQCIFQFKYRCDEKTSLSKNNGIARVKSIISASKAYGDTLHEELQPQLDRDENLTIYYHKNCVSRYTSTSNLNKYYNNENDSPPPVKRVRRSLAGLFDFRTHCLFCGEACELNKDPKNPQRWKAAYLCRSIIKLDGSKSYKEYLLEKCHSRSDQWANQVQHRIESAISDLHAADMRYHKNCYSLFMSNRCLSDDQNSVSVEDKALQLMIDTLHTNRSQIWNSIELFKMYQENNGYVLTRYSLIEQWQQHFQDDLIALTSCGYASIVTFRKNAALMMKMVKDDDESNHIDKSISILANHVVQECKSITIDKTSYQVHIDADIAAEYASDTLLKFLAAVSKKLDKTLPALLIANIVTNVITNNPTPLQVALGVLLRESKTVISHMYDYRVPCSYD